MPKNFVKRPLAAAASASRAIERGSSSEATDFIAVALTKIYFSRFWPRNRMSSPKTI
jgi:hypothetical protein